MDTTVRKNDHCIVGQPSCGFAFSANRTCFIAYGFKTSTLEMDVIKNLLNERGIDAIEAGEVLAPGKNTFCSKICSKIINAQFCIVLLNHDTIGTTEQPNANVNMEYGLMLGFNKYIIPFQKKSQDLPFNVSPLDTVKYETPSFKKQAASAIDQAILETQQTTSSEVTLDQTLESYFLSKHLMYTTLNNLGEENIFNLGRTLQFNLLNDFSGLKYTYFGNFTSLRTELISWKLKTLNEILEKRRESMPDRIRLEMLTDEQASQTIELLDSINIVILTTSESDKIFMQNNLPPTQYPTTIVSLRDVEDDVKESLLVIESGEDQKQS